MIPRGVRGRWSRRSARARTALALAALATWGCQDAPKEPPKAAAPRPLVVASFYPLYDFARQVAGDRAEVVSLVPTGVEPHDWEPSPRDVARVEKAAVFIYNGAGFDAGAERLAENAAASTVVVEATAGLPLLAVDLPRHDKEHVVDPTIYTAFTASARPIAAEGASNHRVECNAVREPKTNLLEGLRCTYRRQPR